MHGRSLFLLIQLALTLNPSIAFGIQIPLQMEIPSKAWVGPAAEEPQAAHVSPRIRVEGENGVMEQMALKESCTSCSSYQQLQLPGEHPLLLSGCCTMVLASWAQTLTEDIRISCGTGIIDYRATANPSCPPLPLVSDGQMFSQEHTERA